jgi:hypothetical protein
MSSCRIARTPRFGAILVVLCILAIAAAGSVPFNGSSNGSVLFTSQTTATVDSLGHATILGPFRSHEELTLTATGIVGDIDWMTADGSTMSAAVDGTFTSQLTVSGTYTVTGGTGRLAGASGTGNFEATLSPDLARVSVRFTGALDSH